MKEFKIFIPNENENFDELDVNLGDEEDDIIYTNTLNEAIVEVYEKYGECLLQWQRKNGSCGIAEYSVNSESYKKAKENKKIHWKL